MFAQLASEGAALADDRVLTHELPFLGGQRGRFLEDAFGDGELADVVQGCCLPDLIDDIGGEA